MAVLEVLSDWAVPAALVLIPIIGATRGVKVYEAFISGARQGVETAVNIVPYLVAILVAIGVFRSSGAMDIMTGLLSPLASFVGIPTEVVPMAVIRPLSGSGSLGVLSELLRTHGPDSFIGLIASTMQGSTETTMYVLTVYFGSVGIRRIRHAVVVGLLADAVGFIAAVFFTKLLLS